MLKSEHPSLVKRELFCMIWSGSHTMEKEQLYSFLKLAKDDEIEAVQVLREWYRQQADK